MSVLSNLMFESGVFETLMYYLAAEDRYSLVVAAKWSKAMSFTGNFRVVSEMGELTIINDGQGEFVCDRDPVAELHNVKRYFVAPSSKVKLGKVTFVNADGYTQREDRAIAPIPWCTNNATVYGRLSTWSEGKITAWSYPWSGKRYKIATRKITTTSKRDSLERVVRYVLGDKPIPLSYPRGFDMVFFGAFGTMPPLNLKGGVDWRVTLLLSIWRPHRVIHAMSDSFNSEPSWDLRTRLAWVEFSHYTYFKKIDIVWDHGESIYIVDPINAILREREVQIAGKGVCDELFRIARLVNQNLVARPPVINYDYHNLIHGFDPNIPPLQSIRPFDWYSPQLKE